MDLLDNVDFTAVIGKLDALTIYKMKFLIPRMLIGLDMQASLNAMWLPEPNRQDRLLSFVWQEKFKKIPPSTYRSMILCAIELGDAEAISKLYVKSYGDFNAVKKSEYDLNMGMKCLNFDHPELITLFVSPPEKVLERIASQYPADQSRLMDDIGRRGLTKSILFLYSSSLIVDEIAAHLYIRTIERKNLRLLKKLDKIRKIEFRGFDLNSAFSGRLSDITRYVFKTHRAVFDNYSVHRCIDTRSMMKWFLKTYRKQRKGLAVTIGGETHDLATYFLNHYRTNEKLAWYMLKVDPTVMTRPEVADYHYKNIILLFKDQPDPVKRRLFNLMLEKRTCSEFTDRYMRPLFKSCLAPIHDEIVNMFLSLCKAGSRKVTILHRLYKIDDSVMTQAFWMVAPKCTRKLLGWLYSRSTLNLTMDSPEVIEFMYSNSKRARLNMRHVVTRAMMYGKGRRYD